MKRIHTLNHRLIACILLISIILQSCGGLQNQVVPQEEVDDTLGIVNKIDTNPLISQEVKTTKGELVNFHAGEHGVVLADIRVDQMQKYANYKNLPVKIEESIDLAILSKLNPKEQQRLIHIQLPRNKQTGRVLIFKEGLMGGGNVSIKGIGPRKDKDELEKEINREENEFQYSHEQSGSNNQEDNDDEFKECLEWEENEFTDYMVEDYYRWDVGVSR